MPKPSLNGASAVLVLSRTRLLILGFSTRKCGCLAVVFIRQSMSRCALVICAEFFWGDSLAASRSSVRGGGTKQKGRSPSSSGEHAADDAESSSSSAPLIPPVWLESCAAAWRRASTTPAAEERFHREKPRNHDGKTPDHDEHASNDDERTQNDGERAPNHASILRWIPGTTSEFSPDSEDLFEVRPHACLGVVWRLLLV